MALIKGHFRPYRSKLSMKGVVPQSERLDPISGDRGTRRPKIFVLLRAGIRERDYRARWEAGLEPDESPYGFHLARQMGGDVEFSEYENANGWIGHVARRALQRLLGLDVLHVLANRKSISTADVVWTMTDVEALGACLLIKMRLVRRVPIVAGTVWLTNRWPNYSRIRRRFFRWLLRECALITVHSRPTLSILQGILPNTNVALMPFGIAANTFHRGTVQLVDRNPIKIVAAGQDLTRDWKTLMDAFGNDDRFRLIVLCNRLNPADYASYKTCELPTDISNADIIQQYSDADYIAVPMVTNLFSGITVALEAAAMGKPILCSRTGGVPTYFGEDEVVYANVDDPADMRDRVLDQSFADRVATAERANTRFKREGYSAENMIRRYCFATNVLLRPVPHEEYEKIAIADRKKQQDSGIKQI